MTFHYVTKKCDAEKTVLDDSHDYQPFQLIIGKQFKLEAWETCVKSMKVNEVASFIVPTAVSFKIFHYKFSCPVTDHFFYKLTCNGEYCLCNMRLRLCVIKFPGLPLEKGRKKKDVFFEMDHHVNFNIVQKHSKINVRKCEIPLKI